ncbi:MAG: FixH family protein [Verrucomicrobiales bacterium]
MATRPYTIVSAALTCLLLFASCGGEEEPEVPGELPCHEEGSGAAPAPQQWPATLPTDGGSFKVTITPESGSIDRNQHFVVGVKVDAGDGEAAGIEVSVDADMPAHRHGMNTKPEVSPLDEEGEFRVEGMLFHMGGDWVISVEVTRAGSTEIASFPVSVE